MVVPREYRLSGQALGLHERYNHRLNVQCERRDQVGWRPHQQRVNPRPKVVLEVGVRPDVHYHHRCDTDEHTLRHCTRHLCRIVWNQQGTAEGHQWRVFHLRSVTRQSRETGCLLRPARSIRPQLGELTLIHPTPQLQGPCILKRSGTRDISHDRQKRRQLLPKTRSVWS